jgi:hypothetical protein
VSDTVKSEVFAEAGRSFNAVEAESVAKEAKESYLMNSFCLLFKIKIKNKES